MSKSKTSSSFFEPAKKRKVAVQYEKEDVSTETSTNYHSEMLDYNGGDNNNYREGLRTIAGNDEKRDAPKKFTEHLAANLSHLVQIQKMGAAEDRRVQGDVPSLALRTEFFMGVQVGWPFATMMAPQRLMALHMIRGLENSKHVVLESPTGTGKSAAILCATLAWQRHHANQNPGEDVVKIYYGSRTHSQVAQMVASLQKTPYRPHMTVLGSRERLCLHEHVSAARGGQSTHECRSRIRATEAAAGKTDLSADHRYQTDAAKDVIKIEGREYAPTCGHYRTLVDESTANAMQQTLRASGGIVHSSTTTPDHNYSNSVDERYENKDGTHDIEDLVQFGQTETSCPYYVSRALEAHAELVFCPYNYILDPGIRKALSIDLEGAVVVLDEAHNVEDTLRGSGSGSWGEMDICAMIKALHYHSSTGTGETATLAGEGKIKVSINKVAHELLLFLEKILIYLIDNKRIFEEKGGAVKALDEWKKFRTPDSKAFETSYNGPTGHGAKHKLIGCAPFFEKIDIDIGTSSTLRNYAEIMNEKMQNNQSRTAALERALFEKLEDLVSKVTLAMAQPADYFIQSTVQANGSLSFASGGLVTESHWQSKPKELPKSDFDTPCQFCRDVKHGHAMVCQDGIVRHGTYNNGSMPPWESFLVLELLSPARFMSSLAGKCRSVILASGSLAPLPSLCAELGLKASEEDLPKSQLSTPKSAQSPTIQTTGGLLRDLIQTELKVETKIPGRLQVKPPPLEADHVVDLDKQLLAVAIGTFPTGEKLTVSYSQYKHDAFLHKLGDAIASAIECIPRGGVLVFLPSYSLLRKCTKAWNPESSYEAFASFDAGTQSNTWERLQTSKGKVIVEPTGSQADFEEARNEYASTIRETGNCVLLAVFRGKMSEGISFNDDNARGVILVGIPYPNSFERSISAKKSYNDEQRKIGKRLDLLDGGSWYSQQAFRAIAQALGRCIRHAGDYGTVILMDSRHCDDSPPDHTGVCMAHRNLPKWMRSYVKSLSNKIVREGSNGKMIGEGWPGLKRTMRAFFDEAPGHGAAVLKKQDEQLLAAQQRAREREAALSAAPNVPSVSSSHNVKPLTPCSSSRVNNPSSVSSGCACAATPMSRESIRPDAACSSMTDIKPCATLSYTTPTPATKVKNENMPRGKSSSTAKSGPEVVVID